MMYVGIDVGQHALDLAATAPVTALPRRVTNDAAGIARVVQALAAVAPTLIVLEATGVYHRPLLGALLAADLPTTVLNPVQLVAFRQERLGREKTDRADAALLARYGAAHDADLRRATPPDPVQARLRELVAYRDSLIAERTRIKNRQHANSFGGDAQVGAWLARDVDDVNARLAAVDAETDHLLAELPEAAVLQQLPGVGPRVTAAVLGYLPRAIWGDAKKAAAYAGVHPRREQSGRRDRSRLSKQGHARLRRYLYVAATVAVGKDPALIAFSARLQTDHTKQSARCAAMHKLLRWMMGALRRFYIEQEQAPMPHAA
jgi:transposase